MTVLEALAKSKNMTVDEVIVAVQNERNPQGQRLPIGVFRYISPLLDIESYDVSLEYYFNRSGKKQISSMYKILLDTKDSIEWNPDLPYEYDIDRELGSLIHNKFRTKWDEMHRLLHYTIDGIKDSYSEKVTNSGEDVDIKNYTDDGKVDTSTASKIVTTDIDKVSAYNSSTFQNSASVERTEQANADDNTSVNISHNTGDSSVRTQYGKTVSRSGRNMPIQDLIEKEIELRRHNYFDIIFKDIDSVLTKPMYL